MDVLSDVLSAVRLSGAVFYEMDAGSPWVGVSPDSKAIAKAIMPGAEHVIQFHAILSGSCWAALYDGDGPPLRVNAGDIIVFPGGHANILSSSPGARSTPPPMSVFQRPVDRPLPFRVVHGGPGGDRTRYVCGYLGCDTRPFNPLLSSLPALICDRRPAEGGGWVTDLFGVALTESGRWGAGTEIVLAKLSELMFVEVVRRYLEALPVDSRGWLSGLRDPHVGEALKLVHARPTEQWTLVGLARRVGLSRTSFADRFVHYVGLPPMQYVARWRMQLASRLLENPGVTLAAAAKEVGYESEAAFNRAFKKLIGVPPGTWRKGRQSSQPAWIARPTASMTV
jgi:AraC-like DNA-binding protein